MTHDVVTDVPESLVVLTHDVELLQTLRAVATEHDISVVGAEADLAAHLLNDHAGVAVLDTASVTSPISLLCDRLKSQFPDLVLVVAGQTQDQSQLTAQITRGTVYRFLHKPVSEQRVRLFVTAAWRRHGVEHAEIVEATATNLRKPNWAAPKPSQKNLVWIGAAAAALVLAILGIALFSGGDEPSPSPATSTLSAASSTGVDAELEQLLARADAAIRKGAYTAPPGDNAVELYRLAVQRKSDDQRATLGLERVIDRLLTNAEQALLQDRIDDAARFVESARTIKPDHVRVAFLTAQIGKERERALLAQARLAASRGNVEQAIAVLDRASIAGTSSPVVAQARSDIAQRSVDNRVNDFLRRATERLRQGALVEPAQNNARFFIESARAIAPNQPEVRTAQRQLADRIVAQARTAIGTGNAEEAERWIDVAGESGVGRDDINALTRDVQRVRIAARAESMARLSQDFNQRLAQGRLVEPTSDSAKFFLAELTRAEANHPSTQLARQALGARLLEEARGAIGRQDLAGARRWMSEAREAGVPESGTAQLEREIVAAQNANNRRGDDEVVTASQLNQTRYVAPEYPAAARERGTGGSVDVIFTVRADGTTSDVAVTAAEPAGIFEQAAMSAVRRWRYEPVKRDGRVVEQRARVRIRFSMEQ
jgi:TonB family protein